MWKRISGLLCILLLTSMPVYAGEPSGPKTGETVNSSEYINKEDIQVFLSRGEEFFGVAGIYNHYDTGEGYFSGSVINEGTIFARSDEFATRIDGISCPIPVKESTISNSGSILAEWSLKDIDADANAWTEVYGLSASHVEQTSITNSGSIVSRAGLNNISLYSSNAATSGIRIGGYRTLIESSILNSGSIESSVNIEKTKGDAEGRADGISAISVYNSSIENSGIINSSVSLSDIGENDNELQILLVQPRGAGAVGILASHVENSVITNSGKITSLARLNNISGDFYNATARGIAIEANNTLKESSILNSGAIDTETSIAVTQGNASGRASGIYSYTSENSAITNSGSISSNVNLGDIGGDYADAHARGIELGDIGRSSEIRIGVLMEESTSEPDPEANWISNSGSIDTMANIDGAQGDASGSVIGISARHAENSTITNSGSINSSVSINDIGGSASALAGGIHIGNRILGTAPKTLIDSTIVNTGSIETSADLTNITGNADVYALGILVDYALSNSKTNTIDNQGTIDVSVSADNSASDTGFMAAGLSIGPSEGNKVRVINSGLIKVDASNLGEFEETIPDNGGNFQIASSALFVGTTADFSNTGRLYTSGNARALSLYEGSDVTLQDGFGYAFAGNPAETKRPVYVDETSALDLNNVPLIAGGAPDTVLGRPYYVVDENSPVENTWGSLKNGFANQDITVDWYGNDRAEDSAVIFNFEPRGSKSARAGMAARTAAYASQSQLSQYLVSGHVFGGEGFLADAQKNSEPILLASAGISDALSLGTAGAAYKNGAYILPYYTGIHDSGLGADITSKGVFLGYERNLDAVTAGVFGGYGNNDVRLADTYKGNQEDQDGYTAGVYGIYNKKKWFGALYASYNETEHDYSGWTGMNYDLRETDEYDSRVFLTEAKAGMKFEDSQWGLYPSMGLTWTNWRTESHTSTVAANPDWNTQNDSLSEDWFQLFAGIDTSRTWNLEDDQKFSLTGGAGIKQALNDNDMAAAQSLMGQNVVVEESMASTTAVLNLAGIYAREAFSVKLGVISQHNEDYDSYTGYLQAGFMW